jgi:hypothetical protein
LTEHLLRTFETQRAVVLAERLRLLEVVFGTAEDEANPHERRLARQVQILRRVCLRASERLSEHDLERDDYDIGTDPLLVGPLVASFLRGLPRDLIRKLDSAHHKYSELHDITWGEFKNNAEREADCDRYSRFLTPQTGSDPHIDEELCAQYMAAKLAVPATLCQLFLTREFLGYVRQGLVQASCSRADDIAMVGLGRVRGELQALAGWLREEGFTSDLHPLLATVTEYEARELGGAKSGGVHGTA